MFGIVAIVDIEPRVDEIEVEYLSEQQEEYCRQQVYGRNYG